MSKSLITKAAAAATILTVGIAGGATAATTGLGTTLFSSPSVGGLSGSTEIGWGNAINGEAASVVVERTGQRSGMPDDDGATFVGRTSMNSTSFPAILGDGGRSAGIVARNNGGPSNAAPLVVEQEASLITNGSKKNYVGADIEGSVKITGKKAVGETTTALLYVEGTDLKVDINGVTYVLTHG